MSVVSRLFSVKGLVMVVVIGGGIGGYLWYRSSKTVDTTPRYGLSAVTRETIIRTVQGTGQVSGNQEIEVKPEASGKILKVLVKVGDEVKEGTPLLELDRSAALKTVRDASQSVRDAELSLQSARLQHQKTLQTADRVSLVQAQNSVAQAKRNLDTLKKGPTEYELKQAEADVESAKKNIRLTSDGTMAQTVRNAYDDQVLALQSAVTTLEKSLIDADNVLGIDNQVNANILNTQTLDSSKRMAAQNGYLSVKDQIKTVSDQIKALKLTNESVATIDMLSNRVITAMQDANTMLTLVADSLRYTVPSTSFSQSQIDSLKSTIDSDHSTLSSKISSTLSQTDAIQSAKDSYESSKISYQKVVNSFEKLKAGPEADAIADAQERLQEVEAQLEKLKATPDLIDVQLSQNSLDQRIASVASARNKLADANETLNDYTVRAPLAGVIATLPAKVATEASSGSAIASIVTTQKMATISLNEVDVAKIKLGQKATLTFDAIEELTLTGEIVQVNPVGTVSQGVVNYGVQIGFDSQDDRIKSGMSVSATIITEVKRDVLAVPNASIKTQGESTYVETLDSVAANASTTTGLITSKETPHRIPVEAGMSNDTLTEIMSGVKEGDRIITQTITGAVRTTTQTNSALRIPGLTGGAGGGAAGGNRTFIQR